uniref:Uncharacterized protein n=1 Tax=Oryza rufipogon TaxID=4529 RepID=A0A0E0N5F9_ORYRU
MAEVYSKSQFKGYIYAPDQLLHYLNKNREAATTPIPNQTRVGDSMQNEGRRPLGRSSRIPAWGSE